MGFYCITDKKKNRKLLLKKCQKCCCYKGLYWEAPHERGAFFRLQVSERVGILLVEMQERVQNSVISVLRRPKRNRAIFV